MSGWKSPLNTLQVYCRGPKNTTDATSPQAEAIKRKTDPEIIIFLIPTTRTFENGCIWLRWIHSYSQVGVYLDFFPSFISFFKNIFSHFLQIFLHVFPFYTYVKDITEHILSYSCLYDCVFKCFSYFIDFMVKYNMFILSCYHTTPRAGSLLLRVLRVFVDGICFFVKLNTPQD